MKRFECLIAIGVLTASTAHSQNAGGTAAPAPSAPSAASAATANQQGVNGGTAQPSPFSQNQPNPNIIRRDQALTAGTNGLAIATNAFNMNSNGFGIISNRFQTNFLTGAGTNSQVSPTSRPGFENRIYSSNNPAAGPYSATNRLGPASSFRTNASIDATAGTSTAAATPADRAMLFSVRQAVQSAFAAGIQPSVNYVVNGGVVTLVGLVPTIEEKFAVQTVAQGVPGVNRVVNNIQVNNSAATLGASNSISTTAAAAAGGTTNFTAINTPRTTVSNGTPVISTNLTPTGNGAARIYSPNRTGLPQGLQNRDTLPSALQNREQLPPGSSTQTNSTSGNTP